ncbi:MAG: neutral zinc metallopeptidase, partial [Burkholderiaceae bacterium]|nr:neutral zinc metallopeptidase [Burkholderiaceae bacterium]
MELDDERESEYVEDRRSGGFADDGLFGGSDLDNEDSFGGRRYGNESFGGGYGGNLFGNLMAGLLGGILGGMMGRSREREQQYGSSQSGWGHGNAPYNSQPQRRGLGFGAKVAIVVAVIAAIVLVFLLRPTVSSLPAPGTQTMPTPHAQSQAHPVDPVMDPQAKQVSEMKKVLAKTEDTWDGLFRQAGSQYLRPKLVLYTGTTPTACGRGQAAMGPFYCPADQKVYLDLRFFNEMERRYRAGGDFARAYVIAHEIGHHVQTLTGVMQKTNAMRQRMSKTEYNKVSVRVELQADCYAGVWAHHANRAKPFLDPGDVDEALKAANAIGDDTL